MDAPKDWRFPLRCPVCDAENGTPYRVASNDDVLTVDVSCGGCGHEWTLSGPSPSMFRNADSTVSFKPKTDRRRQPVKRVG